MLIGVVDVERDRGMVWRGLALRFITSSVSLRD